MSNQISRRTFIKGLAAGAASVATLGVLKQVEYSTKGVSHSMAMYYGYVAGKNAVQGV